MTKIDIEVLFVWGLWALVVGLVFVDSTPIGAEVYPFVPNEWFHVVSWVTTVIGSTILAVGLYQKSQFFSTPGFGKVVSFGYVVAFCFLVQETTLLCAGLYALYFGHPTLIAKVRIVRIGGSELVGWCRSGKHVVLENLDGQEEYSFCWPRSSGLQRMEDDNSWEKGYTCISGRQTAAGMLVRSFFQSECAALSK